MIDRARHSCGILDTNTVVLLPRLHDAAMLPDEALISAVTLAEMSVGQLVALTDKDKADRQACQWPIPG